MSQSGNQSLQNCGHFPSCEKANIHSPPIPYCHCWTQEIDNLSTPPYRARVWTLTHTHTHNKIFYVQSKWWECTLNTNNVMVMLIYDKIKSTASFSMGVNWNTQCIIINFACQWKEACRKNWRKYNHIDETV